MEILDAVDWGAAAHFRFKANEHPGVAEVMRTISQIGNYDAIPIALVILAMLLLLTRGRTGAALLTLAAWGAGYFLVEGLRNVIHRERPHDAWESVDTFEMMSSFPARGVFLWTLAVGLLVPLLWDRTERRSLRWLLTLSVAVVVGLLCMSQIYLRLHYVSDVVGGLLGGLCLAVGNRLLTAPATPAAPMPIAAATPGGVVGGR